MRIGIDCRMYSSRFTGIGRYVYELTHHLFKIDKHNEYVLFFNEPEYSSFDVMAFSRNSGAHDSPAGTPPQTACVTASARHPNDPKIKKVLVNASHYSLKEQLKFLRILNREKLDLMHFTHFNAPILYRRPSIVTIHDLTLSFFPGKKMTSPLHRMGYHLTLKSAIRKAKKIIAVSKNTSKDLQEIYHVDPKKIAVIYEGVNENFKKVEDPHKLELIKKKYALNKPYLLYTGVWRTHKNIPNLLEAFHLLKTEYDFDGYLVITGREDPVYAQEIFEKTAALKIQNETIFTGLVPEEELPPLYSGAAAYVFPSLYEGFGLPPLEAMQCGVPVAASSTSCISEICGENNAVFFDPQNPQDMAEKIFTVLSQKTLRHKLIENGFKRVKDFSWQKMAEETLKVYNDALAG